MPYKEKVAVVGYGSIGRRHVEILQSLDEVAEIIVFTKQKIQTSIKKNTSKSQNNTYISHTPLSKTNNIICIKTVTIFIFIC